MPDQPQLALPLASAPVNTDVEWLEHLLQGTPGWRTAAELVRASLERLDDRAVRSLASASEWIISGQKGYKHLEHATPEEIDHATHWLESQAKKMSDRAGKIRRNAHRRIG